MGQRSYIITKILSFLLLMTLLAFTVPALAQADQVSDIANHWAKEQISDWMNQGLIKSYSDGNFKPENKIKRAEFMALINGAAGYTEKAAISFKDVPADAWYADEVAKAMAVGYISGYKDGTIKPNSLISRQEAAAAIMKVCKLEPNAAAMKKMKDAKRIAAANKGAVGAVINARIMVGYPDGTFKGDNYISRAEAVAALSRALSGRTAAPAVPVSPEVNPAAPANPAAVYDQAGTFGPATGIDTVKDNVTIKAKDVTLQNVIVEGDLTIDKAVGDGNVTLKKVIVKGTTYVNGGGPNSVNFIDTQSGKTCVARMDGTVRIVVSGTTEISQLIAQSSVKVQESADLTGKGVEDLTVEQTVSSTTEVTVDGAKIGKLEIKAAGVTVNTDKNTRIDSLVADAALRIKGGGIIDKASINASGVVLDVKPASMTVSPGVSAPTVNATVSTGGGSGSSSSSTAVTSLIVATEPQLTAALANTNIEAITFTADITASPVANHSVMINFGDYTLTGDLRFTHSGTGTSVLSGSAGTRIIGSLSVDTANASFNNGVTVSGTVNVINVKIGTWTETANGNKLTITDSNGAVITITGNPEVVTITETASGSLTLTVNPGAMVANITSSAPIAITVAAGATVETIVAAGAGTTITNNGFAGTVTASAPVTIVNSAGASVLSIIAGAGADNSTITNNGSAGTVATNVPVNLVANVAPAQTLKGAAGSVTTSGVNAASVALIADTTAPVITDVSVSGVTPTTAVLNFTLNESGVYYYLVKAAEDGAPDAAAIAAQGAAVAKGMGGTMACSRSVIVTGLSICTEYNAYMIEKDAAGNASLVSTINLQTTVPQWYPYPAGCVFLNREYFDMPVGESKAIQATVYPDCATHKEVMFSSDNGSVATVDSQGVVTAHAVGNALISAITVDGGHKCNCHVTVRQTMTEINAASISGLAAPATGGVVPLKTNLTAGDASYYISSIEWKYYYDRAGNWRPEESGYFRANLSYCLIIGLSAMPGYRFPDAGLAPAISGGGTVTVYNCIRKNTYLQCLVSYPATGAAPIDIAAAGVTGLTAPAAGAAPLTLGALTAGNASAYTVTGLTWLNMDGSAANLADGKFITGTAYQAQIELTASSGYRFPAAGLTPTVNDGTAAAGTVSGGNVSGNKLTFVVTFAPEDISAASLTGLIAPVAGADPLAASALTAGHTSYTVTSRTWLNSDGSAATFNSSGEFNASSTYQARIILTAATGYKFPAMGLTPTVNTGTAAAGTVSGGNVSGNTLTFMATFPATGPYAVNIPAADVNGLVAPVAGATPITPGALTAGNATYTVTGPTWLNQDGSAPSLTNGKFNAGNAYKARIELTAASGYRFPAAGLTPTVNAGMAAAGTVSGGNISGNKLIFVVVFTTADISAASVTGMVAPAAGAAPIAASALTAGHTSYTVTSLFWFNADGVTPANFTDGKFNANYTYKARIALTSSSGYKFPTSGLTPTVNTESVGVAGTVNGGDIAGNTLTFMVTFPATGAPPTYAATLGTITHANGDTDSTVTISGSPAAAGATVTLTPVPKAGMRLKTGTLKASYNNGNPQEAVLTPTGSGAYTFIMPAYALTVTATFEAIPVVTYAITWTITRADGDTESTVTISDSLAAEGATITLTVKPKSGFRLITGTLKASYGTLQVASLTQTGEYTYTFPMPANAVTVTATFEVVTPVYLATTTFKTEITLSFTNLVNNCSPTGANGFTIGGTLKNGPVAVTSVLVTGSVILYLDKDLAAGDIITVSYNSNSTAPGMVKLTDLNGNVPSFTNQSVTNTLPTP